MIAALNVGTLLGNMLKLPTIAPLRRAPVLQPKNRRGRVWRNIFDVGRVGGAKQNCTTFPAVRPHQGCYCTRGVARMGLEKATQSC
jgi:hypothetical protein